MSVSIFERHESNVRSYCRSFPAVFSNAHGAWIEAVDGRRFLDFLTGAGSLNYGHNPPGVIARVLEYLERGGIQQSLDLHTEAKAAFIEALQGVILQPRAMNYRIQFTGPTGTNAVEAALKIARKVTGRRTVIAFTNGYHGMSLGALAATANPFKRGGAGVTLQNTVFMPYDGYLGPDVDTLDYIDAMIGRVDSGVDRPAAVLIELVQGEGGLNVASKKWLQGIEAICRRIGALLIVDDIQAGCGRTGQFFSFEGLGISPDVITLSKSLSGFGTPLSIVLLKPEFDQWQPGEHNGTFRGNNLAFVGALAALELYWSNEKFQKTVQSLAAIAQTELERLISSLPPAFARIKGRGLMLGIELKAGQAAAVSADLFEKGMIAETCGVKDHVLKLLPPLTISEQDLAAGISLIGEAVHSVVPTRVAAHA